MTYLQFVARVLLAAVFLASALGKATNSSEFIRTVRRVGIRRRFSAALSWGVITCEAVLALSLALGIFPVFAAIGVMLLLLVFLGVSVRAMLRHLNIPCNCFGRATSSLGIQTLKHVLILFIPLAAYFLSLFFVHSLWWPNTFEAATSSLSIVIATILIGRWLLNLEDLVTLIRDRHQLEEKTA